MGGFVPVETARQGRSDLGVLPGSGLLNLILLGSCERCPNLRSLCLSQEPTTDPATKVLATYLDAIDLHAIVASDPMRQVYPTTLL